VPILPVFNKIDRLADDERADRLCELREHYPDGVAVSAIAGTGLEILASRAASAAGLIAALAPEDMGH
jgi:50S ribosomal subunit-associated GTPase HflX